jgi:hypothetical protein
LRLSPVDEDDATTDAASLRVVTWSFDLFEAPLNRVLTMLIQNILLLVYNNLNVLAKTFFIYVFRDTF